MVKMVKLSEGVPLSRVEVILCGAMRSQSSLHREIVYRGWSDLHAPAQIPLASQLTHLTSTGVLGLCSASACCVAKSLCAIRELLAVAQIHTKRRSPSVSWCRVLGRGRPTFGASVASIRFGPNQIGHTCTGLNPRLTYLIAGT